MEGKNYRDHTIWSFTPVDCVTLSTKLFRKKINNYLNKYYQNFFVKLRNSHIFKNF